MRRKSVAGVVDKSKSGRDQSRPTISTPRKRLTSNQPISKDDCNCYFETGPQDAGEAEAAAEEENVYTDSESGGIRAERDVNDPGKMFAFLPLSLFC